MRTSLFICLLPLVVLVSVVRSHEEEMAVDESSNIDLMAEKTMTEPASLELVAEEENQPTKHRATRQTNWISPRGNWGNNDWGNNWGNLWGNNDWGNNWGNLWGNNDWGNNWGNLWGNNDWGNNWGNLWGNNDWGNNWGNLWGNNDWGNNWGGNNWGNNWDDDSEEQDSWNNWDDNNNWDMYSKDPCKPPRGCQRCPYVNTYSPKKCRNFCLDRSYCFCRN